MLGLCGFELFSRWVPLMHKRDLCSQGTYRLPEYSLEYRVFNPKECV